MKSTLALLTTTLATLTTAQYSGAIFISEKPTCPFPAEGTPFSLTWTASRATNGACLAMDGPVANFTASLVGHPDGADATPPKVFGHCRDEKCGDCVLAPVNFNEKYAIVGVECAEIVSGEYLYIGF